MDGDQKGPKRDETIDAIINRIGEHPTILMFIVASAAMSCSMVGCYCAYMIAFTGFVPAWECLTDTCTAILAANKADDNKIELDTICDSTNNLEKNTDYKFDADRTTLAVEWDMICDTAQLNLLSSMYFVGGTFGLLLGTFLFEHLGRRKASLFGGAVVTVGTFMGTFCNSYGFMIGIRLMQGFGNFTAYSGTYIWVLEFAPERLRIFYNSWSMLIWTIGYPGLVAVSYYIHTWHYIFTAASIIFLVTYIPLLLLPDSPRYLLSVGKVKEAKKVLEKFSSLSGQTLDLSDINVVSENQKITAEKMTFFQTVRMFGRHKAMLLETCVLFWGWFVMSLLFYGLNYGWGAFGDTPYVNYLFVAVGETIAYICLMPIVKFMGRRVGIIFSLFGAFICFILGMIDWEWNDVWNFERFVSIIAIIMISCAFGLVFLYTGELAPTTHRGMILAICSVVARGSAFMGPFVSGISKNRRVKLGLNTFFAGSAALLYFMLPETQKIPIPDSAAAVTLRRHDQDLYNVRSIFSLKTRHKTPLTLTDTEQAGDVVSNHAC